eukprot:CAMPEP_0198224526 /NCGR_PEP_ID=MMETSP1445-20131203/97292_1 /TAXON_ID=36898 /ORGANISM="Pyramimonas sp., Strain CCMP2087" /LENGTH=56 /DNA_ID=CAMNT_0043903735 /DNA_START=70 /DNA_END=240 /DNA_ORIENTATION=-
MNLVHSLVFNAPVGGNARRSNPAASKSEYPPVSAIVGKRALVRSPMQEFLAPEPNI